MAVMGVGLGAMMQNLVLAVQNTVDVRDIGAASATVAFFRTLGGAIGVSVLGAVLATRVQDSTLEGLRHLSRKAAAAAAQSQSAAGLDLAALPAPVRTIVRQSYGDATGRVFVISAVVAAVALLCVVFIKEVPLRTTVKLGDSTENATAGVAGTASPAERSPEVTATAAVTPRWLSHHRAPPPPPGPSRPTGDRQRRRPPRPGGQPRADPGLLRPARRPGGAHGSRRAGRPHRGAGHRPPARHRLPRGPRRGERPARLGRRRGRGSAHAAPAQPRRHPPRGWSPTRSPAGPRAATAPARTACAPTSTACCSTPSRRSTA